MPRRNRTTRARAIVKNHRLVIAEPGRGRKPGRYKCSCGEPFTGIHAFEAHRAAQRPATRERQPA